jgi:hypothetical protein
MLDSLIACKTVAMARFLRICLPAWRIDGYAPPELMLAKHFSMEGRLIAES